MPDHAGPQLGPPQAARSAAGHPTPLIETAAQALYDYRQSLLHALAERQVDTRFVRLRLLDMMRSEHALQFQEREKDYTDLRDVLAEIPERAMVLLGAPGCGKSTLLRRLQLDDANQRMADESDRVSLFVSLGAYPLDKDAAKDAPRPLDWLEAQWHRQAPGLPDLEALLGERRVLLLLDALNEMPHRNADDFRERVEQWRRFLRDDFPPGNRAVFSCRSLDYSETLSVKDDLDVRQVRVQPMTPPQIEEFLRLYAADHADGAWAEIRNDEGLLDLYSTPYFLKLLSDQLAYDPRVAGERAALFTGFVRRALEREIASRHPLFVRDGVLHTRDRDRVAGREWSDAHDLPRRGPLIPSLQALAYAMQERFGGSDGKQVMVTLDEALAHLNHARAEDLLKAGTQLAVLDEERRTDQVRFFHQLLQEYFAARQLAAQPAPATELARSEWRADRIRPSLADKLATLQDFEPLPPPDPTGWEETTILAASMAADPDAFARAIAEANLVLAARCVAALRATNRTKPDTVELLQTRLMERSRDPEADLRARIAAGRALGDLGDPRFERCRGPHGDYLRPPLVAIEAASYRVGSDEGLSADEAPAHDMNIEAFAIGRFPLTNAEWRLFMAAGGYQDERWWHTEAARRWQRGEGIADGPRQQARDFRKTVRDNPAQIDDWLEAGQITSTQARDFTQWYVEMSDGEFEALLDRSFSSAVQTQPRWWHDPAYNQPAQPVVGVCWHEARAYCAWLSAQTGQDYRVPSEVEWEVAARGRARRRYPWGESFDPRRCNSFESHVHGTTPVGVFPDGDTPQGIADMSGNVWEWTGSLYQPYPYGADDGRENSEEGDVRRVVRGGSWRYFREYARCACRNGSHPGDRDNDVGFRVLCVSPIF
ncbi:MAG: SUMF1/EgtB/PvdO family nonheme iron enzyme [Candidatus Accumulibacter phosphatis]|uniref:SUMF1/EgtB/PvdO family nonheme iron enzyme n=1 Tax=Candidatus Accumulibacter phosphatis TaxID=327160 RepID=UPI001A636453|nr:SUMF1/EgtB/PvdO family nonheme iron enzyme [Candidatus Accumulibacter phosphatis]